MRKLFRLLIRLWSHIYTYKTGAWLRSKRDAVYSVWLGSWLGTMGKGSVIAYPCKLWGGGSKSITIGNGTVIQADSTLGCWVEYEGERFNPSISIGDGCNIGEHAHISAINSITIGNGVLTGRNIYIGDNCHGRLTMDEADVPPIRRKLSSKGGITVGDNVWIGDKAVILSGVTIGRGAVIGANSVVTKDVPAYAVVAGVPARVIRQIDK